MKNIKMLFVLVVVLLSLAAVGLFAFGDADQDAISVSIINLIAAPEKFDGKIVQVIGVGQIEFEGNAIYLSKADLKYGVTRNGLWTDPDLKTMKTTEKSLRKMNGRYVIIEGRFNMRRTGHMGLFSGAVENITRYDLWEDSY